MDGREFKDAVFGLFAGMAQAFASPKRLELLDILIQGERDVETLADTAGLTVVNTSRHLQKLKQTRLVETRREGTRIYYRIADEDVARCWKDLQQLAERRLSDIDEVVGKYLSGRESMEPISGEDLLGRLRRGDVLVIDVRPVEEYRAGHIRNAVSIPLADLKRRLAHLPSGMEIVAYCRGPYCVLAVEAVDMLRKAGRTARRLSDGFPEWKNTGRPIQIQKETR
jgi:rhodanese-related sulfurtransferase/predicted transcriptional regulator